MQAKYVLSLLVGIAVIVALAVYGAQAGLFQGSVQGLSGKPGGVVTKGVDASKGIAVYTQKDWPFVCSSDQCTIAVWPTTETGASGNVIFYVDGTKIGDWSQRLPRTYTEGMQGVSLILKKGELSDGNHALTVEVRSGDQKVVKEKTFQVTAGLPR